MPLQWRSKALLDLVGLHEFLAAVNKPAAARVVTSLTGAAATLVANSRIGEKLEEFEPGEVRRLLVGHYGVALRNRGIDGLCFASVAYQGGAMSMTVPKNEASTPRRRPRETNRLKSSKACLPKSATDVGTLSRRRGHCHDNAVVESFFQLLKRERIKRKTYSTSHDARQDIFDYIEMFYDPKRRHGFNDRLSPAEFERRHFERLAGV